MPEKVKRDETREERITMEIIVDAYDAEEQAMGWYYYLEEKIHFPFKAQCQTERRISPLKVGEKVQVIGMAPEEECKREMFVEIEWSSRTLAVPLAQLLPLDPRPENKEAVEDWHYWIAQGYEF